MATKLAPAHRELDGRPLKTGDITRLPTRPRVSDRTPKHARAREHCPYPNCPCQEED